MMKKLYILSGVFIFLLLPAFSQRPVPGKVQDKSILVTNAVIHTGNGKKIEKGAMGFRNGNIDYVADLSQPATRNTQYDITIDAQGKHVYPGFILTNTTLGLREIDAVRASLDYAEIGELKPEVRAISAYNADSKLIPTIRFNGVLVAQSTPRSGLISGQSSVVQLDAWNWEDAALVMEDGMHINWPARNRVIYPWEKGKDETMLIKERNDFLAKIKDLVDRTLMYIKEKEHPVYNGKCEALAGLFTGAKRLYIHANTEKDIIESVTYFESAGVKKITVAEGREAWKITDFLKEHNVSLIIGRVHDLPYTDDDDVKLPYKMAKILWDAGVLFTISYEGDMEVMGSRNLPFTAGTTAAYGLDPEQAVQLITLNAAKILGIDHRLGTLEPGKDATFFISNGDALDMMTNDLEAAYISGRQLDLDNAQQYLYKIYMDKYGLKRD